MKYRTDFVTNSSSSSFIIAHSEYVTEELKNNIVKFALQNFLGDVTCSTEEELVKSFKSEYDGDFEVGEFSDDSGNLINIYDENNKIKDEYLKNHNDYILEKYYICLKEIKVGKCVSLGRIDYDEAEYMLRKLQHDFWGAIKDDNFVGIDDDLMY